MEEKELGYLSAGAYARGAIANARMRNITMASKYSDAQKVQAERMKLGLEMVYAHKGIYINYRMNFIAVKISNPTVRDRKNLRLLEEEYNERGVTKNVTEQGVIYRIKKA